MLVRKINLKISKDTFSYTWLGSSFEILKIRYQISSCRVKKGENNDFFGFDRSPSRISKRQLSVLLMSLSANVWLVADKIPSHLISPV